MRWLLILLASTGIFLTGFFINVLLGSVLEEETRDNLLNPLLTASPTKDTSLLAYSIPNLQERSYQSPKITLEKEIAVGDGFTSYLFSYQTLGKKMTGQLNIPDSLTPLPTQERFAIVLLRGYVPAETYVTGAGTKNAAGYFAQRGYITVAPDFFGFGDSDPEPENSWQARFEKPIAVAELIQGLRAHGIAQNLNDSSKTLLIDDIGLWGHSNGGQIALTTLQALQQNIPTTLWAPVTAPFPYSILYFSDEHTDEGKEARKWLSLFEEDYDVFDFSLTQHLESLTGPIQIHHGTNDDAALVYWSQEFAQKITKENERREMITKTEVSATNSAQAQQSIDLTLFTYVGADHNLSQSWDTVVQRDLQFFKQRLKKEELIE